MSAVKARISGLSAVLDHLIVLQVQPEQSFAVRRVIAQSAKHFVQRFPGFFRLPLQPNIDLLPRWLSGMKTEPEVKCVFHVQAGIPS